MNTIMRKDGTLYIKMHGEDSYRVLEDNDVEIFLTPEQVSEIWFELKKQRGDA